MKGKTSSSNDNEWEADVKYKIKAEMEAHDGKLKVSVFVQECYHKGWVIVNFPID